MRIEHHERPATSSHFSRNLESATSQRSFKSAPSALAFNSDKALDKHNLGVVRPRKLTPLSRMPHNAQFRIESDAKNHRPLHLSVNYTGHCQGWKQTLDPITQGQQRKVEEKLRRDTFVVPNSESRRSSSVEDDDHFN